uniref:Legumain prodomain domain-containing protein n=1 Tax=Ananas comosus var. bracteatus TaxID=296719 RepID=A0A6V7P427_ANACO|nr:unnamed protein product [Ananas comosus var. bracteatus]
MVIGEPELRLRLGIGDDRPSGDADSAKVCSHAALSPEICGGATATAVAIREEAGFGDGRWAEARPHTAAALQAEPRERVEAQPQEDPPRRRRTRRRRQSQRQPKWEPFATQNPGFNEYYKVRTVETYCGSLAQYGMKHMRSLANICNAGVRKESMAEGSSSLHEDPLQLLEFSAERFQRLKHTSKQLWSE